MSRNTVALFTLLLIGTLAGCGDSTDQDNQATEAANDQHQAPPGAEANPTTQPGAGSSADTPSGDNRSSAADKQPPTVPDSLRVQAATPTRFDLNWQHATDNVAVSGYNVYRDGRFVATTSAPAFSDRNLAPNTVYRYTVSAFDAAGNDSGPSAAVSFSNPAGVTVWPDWELRTLGTLQARAYPGIPYRTRLAVAGGKFPYYFYAAAAPDGFTVDSMTGAINWTPAATQSGEHRVAIDITDARGTQIRHQYTLTVTREGFFFVDDDGEDTATRSGEWDQPWRSLAFAAASERALGDEAIVYVRGGHYTENALRLGGDAPSRWLAYPGEAVVLDFDASEWVYRSPEEPGIFSGFEVRNCYQRCLFHESSHDLLIYANHFHTLYADCPGCNPSMLHFRGHNSESARHDKVRILNNLFEGLEVSGGAETSGALVFFDVHHTLVANNTVREMDNYTMVDKDNTYMNTYRDNRLAGAKLGIKGQDGARAIHVHHNIVDGDRFAFKVCEAGPCRDLYFHHNTLVNSGFFFHANWDHPDTDNINVAYNLIATGGDVAYHLYPDEAEYIKSDRSRIDFNLIDLNGAPHVAGFRWGDVNLTVPEWQGLSAPKDLNSLFEPVTLSGSSTDQRLPTSDPRRGVYGHR